MWGLLGALLAACAATVAAGAHGRLLQVARLGRTPGVDFMAAAANNGLDNPANATLAAPSWSYAKSAEWPQSFPSCGKGPQSPIGIDSSCGTSSATGGNVNAPAGQEESGTAGPTICGAENESPELAQAASYHSVFGRVMEHTGHNLETEGDFGTFRFGSEEYRARKLSFRFPAEHILDGKQYAGELQVLHIHAQTGKLLMLSFFIDEGHDNDEFLTELGFNMLNMARRGGQRVPLPEAVNLEVGLQRSLAGHFFRYEGSLTDPPCTPNVKWIVAEIPIEASSEQVLNYKRRFPRGTSRPVQDRQGRSVYRDKMVLQRDLDTMGKSDKSRGLAKSCPLLAALLVVLAAHVQP